MRPFSIQYALIGVMRYTVLLLVLALVVNMVQDKHFISAADMTLYNPFWGLFSLIIFIADGKKYGHAIEKAKSKRNNRS